MKTPLEQAIDLENLFKKQAAKEIAEYRAYKRNSCLMKVHFINPSNPIAHEYNQRNDNDVPWYPPVNRK